MDLQFTHVYESARRSLELDYSEYALANYIAVWASYPNNTRPGWCDRTQGQMADFIGMSDRGIRKVLDRLEASDLVERQGGWARSTVRWFEAIQLAKREEQESRLEKPEQSSVSENRNKVPMKAEQSSAENGTKFLEKRNKVPTHNKGNKEKEEREKDAQPKIDLTSSPRAKTPTELVVAIRSFYEAYPAEWSYGVLELGKGKAFTKERRAEIVTDFACWAIEKNLGTQPYKDINARLQKWFRQEYLNEQSRPKESAPLNEQPTTRLIQ